ncbi:hypothetical protein [Rhodoferax sp.]|uniref:hypothetical protein n=1 Tax=Rhodoferax sp. TaxID=50421 RepID=UPI00374DA333
MLMRFLRKLSLQRGPVCVTKAAELEWVIALKAQQMVYAEVGPTGGRVGAPRPPVYAVVRGLTPAGWSALASAPKESLGRQLLSAAQALLPADWTHGLRKVSAHS